MIRALRLVVLVGDAYGGYGGIAQYNRDLLEALDSCDLVERVYVLPRLIAGTIDRPIPESVVYDRRSAQGKVAFVRRVFAHLCGWLGIQVFFVISGFVIPYSMLRTDYTLRVFLPVRASFREASCAPTAAISRSLLLTFGKSSRSSSLT